jgi:hypothetical protein
MGGYITCATDLPWLKQLQFLNVICNFTFYFILGLDSGYVHILSNKVSFIKKIQEDNVFILALDFWFFNMCLLILKFSSWFFKLASSLFFNPYFLQFVFEGSSSTWLNQLRALYSCVYYIQNYTRCTFRSPSFSKTQEEVKFLQTIVCILNLV